LKGIIAKNFPKKGGDKGRFMQIDESEIKGRYNSKQNLNTDFTDKSSLVDFNKYTYNKILDLFSNKGEGVDNFEKESEKRYENITNDIQSKYKLKLDNSEMSSNKKLKSIDKYVSSQFDEEEAKKEEILDRKKEKNILNDDNSDIEENDIKSNHDNLDKSSSQVNEDNVSFNLNSCLEMQKKFSGLNLNCNNLEKDYQEVFSFLETHNSVMLNSKERNANKSNLKSGNKNKIKEKTNLRGGDEDFINVKFSAAEDSYPTIEKLVAQMMTRRDLAEKFERLKILEFETNLQKAENEMIQDILHDSLYKVMAKYGPAIEGMKQHIK
jgi:hypothetical protein